MNSIKIPKILVVDDDSGLRDLLRQYLEKQGFDIDSAEDGKEMDSYLKKSTPDLIILDLMLPGEDGLSIAKRLQVNNQIPIIMLSACGEEIDKIIGLEVGADDYLAKPFNPRELLARIRSVLRRHNPLKTSDTENKPAVFSFGSYQLNIQNQSLKRDNEDISITSGEFSLLKFF